MTKPNLSAFTDEQLARRLDTVEAMIAACRDEKNRPTLNHCFQELLDEQVRRDLGRKP